MAVRQTSNKKYQAQFEKFNTQYFDEKLPRYRIKVKGQIPGWGSSPCGKTYRKQRIIMLVPNKDFDMKATLLHEMAHASTNDNHGPKWMAEMERLKAVGAPVDKADFDCTSPKYLTKQFVKAEATDYVLERPSKTFREFLRWFSYSSTGSRGLSARGIVRKYPWVKKAFYQGKQESNELLEVDTKLRKQVLGFLDKKGKAEDDPDGIN